MHAKDLREHMLVRDGRTLLQVSSVYEKYATLTVVLEWSKKEGYHAPSRTRVRSYTNEDIAVYLDEPFDSQIKKMDEVYSRA